MIKYFPSGQRLQHYSSQYQMPRTYYLKWKNEIQQQIFHNHHPQEQRQDPRFISPPTHIPLTNISITECNPSKDINTQTHTIQIQQNSAHIYDNSGKYLISIPICRLTWLWNQYQNGLNNPQNLKPQTQPFEIEIVWLYQRYKYKIPKTDP